MKGDKLQRNSFLCTFQSINQIDMQNEEMEILKENIPVFSLCKKSETRRQYMYGNAQRYGLTSGSQSLFSTSAMTTLSHEEFSDSTWRMEGRRERQRVQLGE